MKSGEESTSPPCDRTEYLSVLGSIGWPAKMTRPDLLVYFVVLACHMVAPTEENLAFAYHLLGYLVATKSYKITYGGRIRLPMGLTDVPPEYFSSCGLHSFSDSSWGKSPKPLGGFVIFVLNGPVDWEANKVKIIPESTCEAETAVGSRATKAIMFYRALANFIGMPLFGPTLLLIDNEAMYKACNKEGTTARTRYFERSTTFVKEMAMRKFIDLRLVPTDEEVADVFTKAVTFEVHKKMISHLFALGVEAREAMMAKAGKMMNKLHSILRMFEH